MPRVCVDKQTGTTAATKKEVDNPCLIWYKEGPQAGRLWKTERKPTNAGEKGKDAGDMPSREELHGGGNGSMDEQGFC